MDEEDHAESYDPLLMYVRGKEMAHENIKTCPFCKSKNVNLEKIYRLFFELSGDKSGAAYRRIVSESLEPSYIDRLTHKLLDSTGEKYDLDPEGYNKFVQEVLGQELLPKD